MRKTTVLAIFAFALAANSCQSSKKNESRPGSSDKPSGSYETEGVTITGEVPPAKTVDFVESEESVQISGVNLTGDQHELIVDVLEFDAAGLPQFVESHKSNFSGNEFRVEGVPYGRYVSLKLDGKRSSLIQPVNQPTNGATNVGVYARIDNDMVVAARLFELSMKGISTTGSDLQNVRDKIISIPSLVVLAGSINEAHRLKKANESGSLSLDLKSAAQVFMSQSATEASLIPAEQRQNVALAISRASVGTLHSGSKKGSSSLIAALITSSQIKRDTVADIGGTLEGYDPAGRTVKEIAKTNPLVFVGYSTSQDISTKYAIEIEMNGQMSDSAQRELNASYEEEYSRYMQNPDDYQNVVSSYVPPALPKDYPTTQENPGSYSSGPSSSPSPTPTSSSAPPTSAPSPSPSGSSSPEPSSSPSPSESPSPGPSPSESPPIGP